VTDFPDLKIKALVAFPATVLDGNGIDVVREDGNYQFNLAFDDFAPVGVVTDGTNQCALLWNSLTGAYTLVPAATLVTLAAGVDKQVLFNDAGAVAGNAGLTFNKTTAALLIGAAGLVGFSDVAMSRVVAGVAEINTGTPGTRAFFQWAGQARVASDFGTGANNTALANVTGLTVSLAAGRTYSFEAYLPFTCAAAGGVKAAISGTATATNIVYSGYIIDSGANGIKGNTQATALATAVANAATTGTTGVIRISGTITVNAAGTLTVQFAQNVNNGTQSVVKRGATLIVHDLP
jgi:hypothetical protein